MVLHNQVFNFVKCKETSTMCLKNLPLDVVLLLMNYYAKCVVMQSKHHK